MVDDSGNPLTDKAASSSAETPKSTDDSKLDTSILSHQSLASVVSTVPGEDPLEIREPILFRNLSKISLLNYAEKLLDCPQVNQSLSRVPIEFVVLKNLKSKEDPMIPVTESYFAMPLYHVLNEEMINFDSPDLPNNDLPFLCDRYADIKPTFDDLDCSP